jgi:hypothetical protein
MRLSKPGGGWVRAHKHPAHHLLVLLQRRRLQRAVATARQAAVLLLRLQERMLQWWPRFACVSRPVRSLLSRQHHRLP